VHLDAGKSGLFWVTDRLHTTAQQWQARRVKVIIWVQGHSLKSMALELGKKTSEFTGFFLPYLYKLPTTEKNKDPFSHCSFPKACLSFNPCSQRLGEAEQRQQD